MEIFKGLKLSNSKTEAGWHKSIQGSFLVVPRGTQMVASDDLIIELYREVFFKTLSEGDLKRIDPEEIEDGEPVFTDQEKYSLYMSRGRKKQTKNTVKLKKVRALFSSLFLSFVDYVLHFPLQNPIKKVSPLIFVPDFLIEYRKVGNLTIMYPSWDLEVWKF